MGVPLSDRSGRVKAPAADVTLPLAPADRERLRKLNDLRKDEELWEYERQHERNKRRYLGDDVLKSAGRAVVWLLARHENEIEKAKPTPARRIPPTRRERRERSMTPRHTPGQESGTG
ncbi:hypothetical protein ACPCB7_22395 [Streptomyces arboris]|uniref:hypothetical protein n=1 Tax=Streptomyces arboris TaxID=2600619 RepID=UPI003C30E0BA